MQFSRSCCRTADPRKIGTSDYLGINNEKMIVNKKETNQMHNAHRSRDSEGENWGQFVDIVETYEEIERRSKYLSRSSYSNARAQINFVCA